jgi:hypothetical protein
MPHMDYPSDYEDYEPPARELRPSIKSDPLSELMTATQKRAEAEEETKALALKKKQLEAEIQRLSKARVENAKTSEQALEALFVNFLTGAMDGSVGDFRITIVASRHFSSAMIVWKDNAGGRWRVVAVRDGNPFNPAFFLNSSLEGFIPAAVDKLQAQLQLYMKAWVWVSEEHMPFLHHVPAFQRNPVKGDQ